MFCFGFAWKVDAKEKAEKILNAALAGSKETMARSLQESTNKSVHIMKKMIAEAHDLAQQTRKFSRFVFLSSGVMLTTSCLFMLLFCIYVLK
ncbi:TPA: hypothetical protein ACGYSL_002954 [Legionella pneumophila]